MHPTVLSMRQRFFRWRCFADYGEGLAGDLFVHLLSGIQCVSGINAVPTRAYSTGSLTHFKDGRDYPDLLATLYDYPGVDREPSLQSEQRTGEPPSSTEGRHLTINGDSSRFTPQDARPQPEGYSAHRLDRRSQEEILRRMARRASGTPGHPRSAETFSAPRDYDDTAAHIATFFNAVETREHVVEDEVFGNNAAIACHMANHSYLHESAAIWDAAAQSIKA